MLNSNYRTFQDAPVPPGYETAYAHFSRENPEAFDCLEDPETAVADGAYPDLFAMIERHGLKAIEVEAPTALKNRGIEKVAAFPMKVLWQHFG